MKIAIDLTPAVQGHAGVGRYADELARALVALGTGDDIRLFYADPLCRAPGPPLDVLPHKKTRSSNKLWRMSVLLAFYAQFPMDSLFGDAEVFHATDHLLPPLRTKRSVFTLHDLAFLRYPETHLRLNRWFLRLMMPRFLRGADAIICVSQHTKEEATRFYGLEGSHIAVIPEGVDSRFRPVQDPGILDAVRARYNLPERFILFVGTIEPRKNLVALWEAYRALRAEGRSEGLVVVGKRGWRYEPILQHLRDLGLEDQVTFPGFVPEADLPAMLSAADLFVYPSLYEGFGLPPLEAMSTGCPVICSDTSSMPEVCGDAAVLVPPTDVGTLVGAARRLLDDAALRQELRARGLEQAARFTWHETARRTLEVYRSVVDASYCARR